MPKRKIKRKTMEDKPAQISLPKMIEKAAKGLYYISETDAEILPFVGVEAKAVAKEEILKQTQNKPDAPIEERSFDEVFQRLTAMQDWFGDEEKATAESYAKLRDLLLKNLKDLKVFKIGSIEIDVYFVGLDDERVLTGIKTKAIET